MRKILVLDLANNIIKLVKLDVHQDDEIGAELIEAVPNIETDCLWMEINDDTKFQNIVLCND